MFCRRCSYANVMSDILTWTELYCCTLSLIYTLVEIWHQFTLPTSKRTQLVAEKGPSFSAPASTGELWSRSVNCPELHQISSELANPDGRAASDGSSPSEPLMRACASPSAELSVRNVPCRDVNLFRPTFPEINPHGLTRAFTSSHDTPRQRNLGPLLNTMKRVESAVLKQLPHLLFSPPLFPFSNSPPHLGLSVFIPISL